MDVPERYADRYDSASYKDDSPVGIAVVNDSIEEWVAWIPERIWERTLALGAAYRLLVLNLLQGQERMELNHPQIQSFLDELQLIGATVEDDLLAGHLEDDLLAGHLEEIAAAAARVIGEPGLVRLLIETS